MLLLAAVALVMPAIFELVAGAGLPRPTDEAIDFPADLDRLSVGVAVVLLITYAAGLVFSLRTHRDLFNPSHDEADHGGEPWSVRRAVTMLAIAGVAVGVMSEILVGSITEASENLGLSPFFVGIIVVAIVGNAAEHWVAIYFALRDKMDLAVNIAIGSSAQIALFVAPVLVLRRSWSGRSRWRWCSTASRSAPSSWPSSSPTRSPRRASRPGSRASSCWPCTPCSR